MSWWILRASFSSLDKQQISIMQAKRKSSSCRSSTVIKEGQESFIKLKNDNTLKKKAHKHTLAMSECESSKEMMNDVSAVQVTPQTGDKRGMGLLMV